MNRAADLLKDYDRLGRLLAKAEGSGAAAIARERRILGELLESLERSEVTPVVDQLATRRGTKSGAARPPARRRKPG